MARHPKQERSRLTVDAIVQAGFICVAERGLEHTTTRHIADTAGLSVGSVYEYFTNKEAVFQAMTERFSREVVEMLQPLTQDIARRPIDQAVHQILSLFGEFLQRNEQRYLKCARYVMQMDATGYMEPIVRVLMSIAVQHLMHHPENTRIHRLPAMSYIFIHGGMYAVVRHLSDPNPPITYEELSEGLSAMVGHYVSRELELSR
ncbi:TetR/AcrR family transcriptional regulator [Isoalcanivorax beigongshangi]|uniref:TetR/AcrR family transcriptional regulator n=1 Tax=Isoalcanivorax beigongshangi TaxID=3238810 RepID=A0ABV4AKE9_9GAMM